MIRTLIFALILSFSASATAAEWVSISPDLCKTTRTSFMGQIPGLGFSVIQKGNISTGSAIFTLCLRKNSNGVYSRWQVEPRSGAFCRTAHRSLGTGGSDCPNPFP